MKTGYKLAAAFTVLMASILLLIVCGRLFGGGALTLFWSVSTTFASIAFMAALPLTILWLMDLSRELRSLDSKRPFVRAVGLLLGLPQAIFGLLGIAIGICVIAWVIYNSLWQRSENYTGGFLSFDPWLGLVALGLGLLAKAFRRGPPRD